MKKKDEKPADIQSFQQKDTLRVQACERFLLYLSRINFSVLVKRVYAPGMSVNDFQLALITSVQDEFEHNMAQRLYVTEETWNLISLSKEEVLQNIDVFFAGAEGKNVAECASTLVSYANPMAERAIINIKKEFNLI